MEVTRSKHCGRSLKVGQAKGGEGPGKETRWSKTWSGNPKEWELFLAEKATALASPTGEAPEDYLLPGRENETNRRHGPACEVFFVYVTAWKNLQPSMW